ncbi:MAG TPA: hypothetical protein P5244_13040 [Syntrophales bacterium]|nr:hypothetical protein [Syntrophales bacterium]
MAARRESGGMVQDNKADAVRLRPGQAVDILVNQDALYDRADVRRSIVYDMTKEGKIILSQTTPALASYHIGNSMDITFVHKGQEGPVRLGVNAKLTEIIKEFQLHSNEKVPALLMVGRTDRGLKTYDLRMFHRVKPGPMSRVRFILNDSEWPLMNLSIGGPSFNHASQQPLEVGKTYPAFIEIDGTGYAVDVKIIRVWTVPDPQRSRFQSVSAQFVNADRRLEFVLGGKVFEIEREQLSRGLE